VLRVVVDDSKTVTNQEITEQIHELFFEDRRISSKSIAEQPVI